ncbi:unnamed protein product, partial [marine sediment metagenome]
TLQPQTTKLDKTAWRNFKRSAQATLGKGGAHIRLASRSGNVKLLAI